MSRPNLWNLPTFEWLDAKGSLHKRYAAFSASVPKSFRGIQDVRVEGPRLRIIEREGGPGVEIDLGREF